MDSQRHHDCKMLIAQETSSDPCPSACVVMLAGEPQGCQLELWVGLLWLAAARMVYEVGYAFVSSEPCEKLATDALSSCSRGNAWGRSSHVCPAAGQHTCKGLQWTLPDRNKLANKMWRPMVRLRRLLCSLGPLITSPWQVSYRRMSLHAPDGLSDHALLWTTPASLPRTASRRAGAGSLTTRLPQRRWAEGTKPRLPTRTACRRYQHAPNSLLVAFKTQLRQLQRKHRSGVVGYLNQC